MSTKGTKDTPNQRNGLPVSGHSTSRSPGQTSPTEAEPFWPDPQPEQQPWRTREDAQGWQVVYRGRGERRQVRSALVVELTGDQEDWLDETAEAAGVSPDDLLRQLIDQARQAQATNAGDSAKHRASTQPRPATVP